MLLILVIETSEWILFNPGTAVPPHGYSTAGGVTACLTQSFDGTLYLDSEGANTQKVNPV